MTLTWRAKDERYFWSDWFTGHGYRTLSWLFVLLSAVDLYATVRLLTVGGREGNALANGVLQQYGLPGFALYKIALVGVILLALYLVNQRNPRLAILVLWGANLLMTYIALWHIAALSFSVYVAGF